MTDETRKDDEKFIDLVTKQHPTVNSYVRSLQKSEDVIEEDDNKMDDLLCLQSMSAEGDAIEEKSIEEKYEDELLIDHITKAVNQDVESWLFEEGDIIYDSDGIIEIDAGIEDIEF